ncbi:MAG: SGNH/GDSL hydrolase family protein [Planctomycetota bacterium]
MSGTSERPIRRRGRLWWAAYYAAAALLAFAIGEFAARWRIEGGVLAALASVVGRRGPWAGSADAPLVPHGELGYVLNPTLPGVNSLGFRGPEVEPGPHPGIERLLVLGDSIAYGEGSFPDGLRDRLARGNGAVEVLNASVPGYTTHQERLFFERRLAPLASDRVLLQYCLNDHHRFLHHIAADGRRLLSPEARRGPPGKDPGWFSFLAQRSYLLTEARRRLHLRRVAASSRGPWETRKDIAPAWRDESWPTFAAELAALRDAVGAKAGRLLVAAFPIEEQLHPARLVSDREETLKPQRELARVCADVGLPLIDLFEDFRAAAERGERLFRDGIHLTEAGHALAAEALAARLPR